MNEAPEWMRHPPTPPPSPEIDTSVAHSARVWNYWLGGKDNFAADREAGDMVRKIFPGIVDAARYTRAFLGRAVRYLAADVGIRQFLDIGTGLPTAANTHEIAQQVAPECRIVYVDNDPLVLVHARALLTTKPEGVTSYIDADLRAPDSVLAEASQTLDLTQPVGLTILGTMGHVADAEDPHAIVRRYLEALPSGSYLVLSDGTSTSPEVIESHRQYNESGATPYYLRSTEQVAQFFDGLELVEPGVVPLTHWRPDTSETSPPQVDGYAGVARKP